VPKTSIAPTEDGMVAENFPMVGAAAGGHRVLTPEQAREIGVAFIVAACMADYNPMSVDEIRQLKRAVFR